MLRITLPNQQPSRQPLRSLPPFALQIQSGSHTSHPAGKPGDVCTLGCCLDPDSRPQTTTAHLNAHLKARLPYPRRLLPSVNMISLETQQTRRLDTSSSKHAAGPHSAASWLQPLLSLCREFDCRSVGGAAMAAAERSGRSKQCS